MFAIRYGVMFLLCAVTAEVFGQIPKYILNDVTEELYDAKSYSPAAGPIDKRLGVYGFGESEGEWDLVILKNGDSLIVQAWSSKWGENYYTKQEDWLRECKTFNKVTVDNNRFYFGKYSGMFVDYKSSGKTTKKVLLTGVPTYARTYGKDSAVTGSYSSSAGVLFDEYGELSLAVQDDKYFEERTKQELKIMRNTIMARYGLVFQAGGEMEKYFGKKDWYHPHLKDVSNCLTTIELKNIQTLQRFEQR